eukprot:6281242-Alexandrium_andersonii.AAC.1
MSASLVGSEMCIRDRNNVVRKRGRGDYWLQQGSSWTRVHAKQRRALPVSYTHLTLPTICSV